jgi:hypothetical protein
MKNVLFWLAVAVVVLLLLLAWEITAGFAGKTTPFTPFWRLVEPILKPIFSLFGHKQSQPVPIAALGNLSADDKIAAGIP